MELNNYVTNVGITIKLRCVAHFNV